MTVAAVLLYIVWFTITFGIRTVLHLRRSGDSGFRGLSGRPASAPWWAGILFALALLTGLLAPIVALLGLQSVPGLEQAALQAVGLVTAAAGVIATAAAWGRRGGSGSTRPNAPAWSPPARSDGPAPRSSPP